MNISSATAGVVPELLKDLAILARSTVDRKDLIKPYWKSENISLGGQQAYYSQFFQRLYTERRLTGQ